MRLAVGRPRRRVVGERVLGEVDDLLGLEVDGEDVGVAAAHARERDQLAVGREVRRLRRVDRRQRDAHLDLAVETTFCTISERSFSVRTK